MTLNGTEPTSPATPRASPDAFKAGGGGSSAMTSRFPSET